MESLIPCFFYKRSNPHPRCTSAKHTHRLMNGHVSYIYTLSHTYTSGRAGAGQADWNYQARPWALSTNFQRKQILDATLIFPFNTDQESSWHICSLPMIQFASDLSSHPTLSFSRLQSVKVTQRCASKLIKRKGRKNFFSLLPEFIKVSPAGGNRVDNGICFSARHRVETCF